MEKKTIAASGSFGAASEEANQMVVMDPDHVIRLVSCDDGFRENSIRFDIGFQAPVSNFNCEGKLEHRPQRLIRIPS